jgi:hypothetical protein
MRIAAASRLLTRRVASEVKISKSYISHMIKRAPQYRDNSYHTHLLMRNFSQEKDQNGVGDSSKPLVEPTVETEEESANTKEDRELLRDFFTGLARLSGNDALIESNRIKEFDKLVASLLKENLYPILISPAILNPLFKKYNFDLREFGIGAKNFAYPTINTLFGTLITAVHRPEKFSPEAVATVSKELRSLVSDRQWEQCQKLLADKELEATLVRRRPDTEVSQVNIFYLNTRIVGDFPPLSVKKSNGVEGSKDQLIDVTSDSTPKEVDNDDEFEEEDIYLHNVAAPRNRISKSEDLRRYIKGSVVATIKCSFFSHQHFAKGKTNAKSFLIVETWTFEGCISGQTPLEWIVTNIQGPKPATILQHMWYHLLQVAGKFTLWSLPGASN